MSTVQPPSGGLIGFSNYNLYDNCENLTGVSVTVDVTEEMVAIPSAPSVAGIQSNGIGFQLNCLPRAGGTITWQQYIMVVSRTGEDLRWGVNNWDTNPADTDGIIDQGGDLATLPSPFGAGYARIPAGYRLEMALTNDASDNITGATFSMYDQNGTAVFPPETVALTSLTDVHGHPITIAELSPIVDIDFVIVGYANGAATTLVRGAGTVTYRATNPLAVLNTFPSCTAGVNTAESSNVRYGELDSSASTEIVQTFQVSGSQLPPLLASFQTVDDYQHIYVLGTNGNLWLEQPPFGSPPPKRTQVDGNVFAFQALDNQTVMVLGTDGNLWLEQGPFGTVPPHRMQVDGNVQAMQALSSGEVLVLGNDGSLWLEQGPFGTVPPKRVQVDGNVNGFHAVNDNNIFVLGADGNLWLEQGPFGSVPPSRQQVDANVRSFAALGVYGFVWVLGMDGNLWLEFAPFGPIPPSNRVLIDSNVLAMQPVDLNDVIVLRTDGTLWLEQGSSASTPVTRTQIDGNVMEFAASDTSKVLVLGGDGNLWLEQAPFGPVPPARQLVDGDVA